ncbi:hypothetical protein AAVH_08078 [Aphelenchoides avenae]|nr:hypothetical protein AAVH_08078 [Aphelenchus avenae]
MALEDDARTSASEDDDVEVLEETDAEELSAERRAAICIAVLGRPATPAHAPRHVPDAAEEPGRAKDDAKEDAAARGESADVGQAEDGDRAESDDDLRLTQALTIHRIRVAADYGDVRDALDDFCGPDWRDEARILREHPVEEHVCDSGHQSADDSGDSDDETTDVLLELHRMVAGNLEGFVKTVERRSEEERRIELRLAEISLAKEYGERQIAMHSVEIKQLMDRLKSVTKEERRMIPARIEDLEAASTTCEEAIQELQHEEKQLLARRDRLRRKALNRALSGLLREAAVDAQHRQLVLLIAENAALRERLEHYEAYEDVEPCVAQIAVADETAVTDDGEDRRAEGNGFSNTSLPSSWTPGAGSPIHRHPFEVVSQSRGIVDIVPRTLIAFLWVVIIAYAVAFLYFINTSNGR